MENNKVIQVRDEEIVNEGYEQGRAIFETLNSSAFRGDTNAVEIESEARIRFLKIGNSNISKLESEVLEAYAATAKTGAGFENLQKVRKSENQYDSLIYTIPVIDTLGTNTPYLRGVWSIRLAKSNLIKRIGSRK